MAIRTVRGTLTNEGVECQALRSTTGEFTLVGNLGGFKAGDRVVVVGTEVEISYCMQGTTLGIISITADGDRRQEAPDATAPSNAGVGSRRDFGHGTYKCLRMGDFILLRAEGTLPNLNSKAELVQMPWRIWPPRFGLYFQHEQIVMPATRPFAISQLFGFPRGPNSVVVHDADGAHNVPIESLPAAEAWSLAAAGEASTVKTGYSAVSLQEAFDAAVAQLPTAPSVPDGFMTYTVKRQGLQSGGFVGLRLYFVQVDSATETGIHS